MEPITGAAALPGTAAKVSGGTADPNNAASGTKQSRVLALLRSPAGATITAMMQVTGWQQHSVRGFLAGVVRKRLKLGLISKKLDGNRVYRISNGGDAKVKAREPKRPAAGLKNSSSTQPQIRKRLQHARAARMRPGTAPASLRGNSGMRQAARPGFYGACKEGAAEKLADDFGKTPRLITASLCFRCGANTGRQCGRHC
jgi:hypothetical protein